MVSNMTSFMIFAVFDLLRLTLCIKCSFYVPSQCYVRRCGLLLPTKYRGLSVCRSVCQYVTVVSPAKTVQPIEISFELRIRADSRNYVLHWVQISHGNGHFLGKGLPL